MELAGYIGCLWVFWNTSVGMVLILSTHLQFIHCQVDRQRGGSWCFTIVYDSLKDHLQYKLFSSLSVLHAFLNTSCFGFKSQGISELWMKIETPDTIMHVQSLKVIKAWFKALRMPIEFGVGIRLSWQIWLFLFISSYILMICF